MIQRVLMIALIAGVVAGLFVSVVQMGKVIPLILEAETYETQNTSTELSHSHDEIQNWAPDGRLERTLYTTLSNILTGVGFALLLCAAIVMHGKNIDFKEGLFWGSAGFLAFSLMPSLGLPPELPGIDAADVQSRQIWWLLTEISTVIGLSLCVFKKNLIWKGAGIVFLLMPHVVGSPHLVQPTDNVPASLASEFAIASVVTSGLFWLVIGGTSGWLFNYFESHS